MFGIKYIKFDATTYVIHYSNGKIVKEGRGLAFFYFAPKSSLVAIPMGSSDVQFVFNETTADFQTISIQGQITYKIENPKQLAELLDFSVNFRGLPKSNDADKIVQRLTNEAQTATSAFLQSVPLTEALRSAQQIEQIIDEGLKSSPAIALLGIVPLGVNIIAAKPSPEMSRALEAETREALQQKADQATYERRNFAVEQERKIKESELSTEIAVEEKKKQIVEKKMETEFLTQENQQRLQEKRMEAKIAQEKQKQTLIDIKVENDKKEADAKSYTIRTQLEAYKALDWKTIMAINNQGDAKLNVALAFRELAEKAENIQNLNITPDLLQKLIDESTGGAPSKRGK
ncbi:MAG: membrane protease subunit, stomatin/prohibitin [Thermonemataceae bacterium]